MSKLVLDNVSMEDDFFENTSLIGIGSALPGYKFCWTLNTFLDMDFKRDEEQNLSITKKKQELHFPIYYHIRNGNRTILYQIKCGNESLLSEIKSIDFILLIEATTCIADAISINKKLLNLPDIHFSKIMYPEDLKNRHNLIV